MGGPAAGAAGFGAARSLSVLAAISSRRDVLVPLSEHVGDRLLGQGAGAEQGQGVVRLGQDWKLRLTATVFWCTVTLSAGALRCEGVPATSVKRLHSTSHSPGLAPFPHLACLRGNMQMRAQYTTPSTAPTPFGTAMNRSLMAMPYTSQRLPAGRGAQERWRRHASERHSAAVSRGRCSGLAELRVPVWHRSLPATGVAGHPRPQPAHTAPAHR